MSSSQKRKNKYILSFFLVISLSMMIVLFFRLYEKPNCFDNKLNGDEDGIDCGGSCDLVCSFDIVAPIIQWSRVVKTSEGIYGVVSMVENLNVSAQAESVPYVFKLYDIDGLLVKEKRGYAFIAANSTFPVYEGTINTGKRIPVRATFEFTKNPYWVKSFEDYKDLITVKNIDFQEKNGASKVFAKIENNTVRNLKNIELVVLLLDEEENIINSSKTVIDEIEKGGFENAIFTWPILFDKEITKTDLVLVSKIE